MFSLHGKNAFITGGTSGIGIGVGTGSAPVAAGLPGAQYHYVGTGFPVRGMARRCTTYQSLAPQLGHWPCATLVLLISVFLAYTLKLNGHEHHRPVTPNAFLSGDSPIVE